MDPQTNQQPEQVQPAPQQASTPQEGTSIPPLQKSSSGGKKKLGLILGLIVLLGLLVGGYFVYSIYVSPQVDTAMEDSSMEMEVEDDVMTQLENDLEEAEMELDSLEADLDADLDLGTELDVSL